MCNPRKCSEVQSIDMIFYYIHNIYCSEYSIWSNMWFDAHLLPLPARLTTSGFYVGKTKLEVLNTINKIEGINLKAWWQWMFSICSIMIRNHKKDYSYHFFHPNWFHHQLNKREPPGSSIYWGTNGGVSNARGPQNISASFFEAHLWRIIVAYYDHSLLHP